MSVAWFTVPQCGHTGPCGHIRASSHARARSASWKIGFEKSDMVENLNDVFRRLLGRQSEFPELLKDRQHLRALRRGMGVHGGCRRELDRLVDGILDDLHRDA